jgi:hypothetical protein
MIIGSSGCLLNIDSDYIIKKSFAIDYNKRLINQMNKQKNFHNFSVYRAVNVLDSFIGDDNLFSFKMEFINSPDLIDLLSVCEIDVIYSFIENIKIYFNNFSVSDTKIPVSILEKKVENILIDFPDELLVNKFNELKSDIFIPICPCHGDFSLSNMLFDSDTIYLFDFLDTFLETPLQDIVKIRQDTKYLYFLNLQKEKNFNYSRLKIIMDFIDCKLDEFFQSFDYYRYYRLFQFINFLRILPYTKNNNRENFIKKILYNI